MLKPSSLLVMLRSKELIPIECACRIYFLSYTYTKEVHILGRNLFKFHWYFHSFSL